MDPNSTNQAKIKPHGNNTMRFGRIGVCICLNKIQGFINDVEVEGVPLAVREIGFKHGLDVTSNLAETGVIQRREIECFLL